MNWFNLVCRWGRILFAFFVFVTKNHKDTPNTDRKKRTHLIMQRHFEITSSSFFSLFVCLSRSFHSDCFYLSSILEQKKRNPICLTQINKENKFHSFSFCDYSFVFFFLKVLFRALHFKEWRHRVLVSCFFFVWFRKPNSKV